jgi:hypothetical protein
MVVSTSLWPSSLWFVLSSLEIEAAPSHMELETERSNVFLAYSRLDERVARPFIEALNKHQISVWWDISKIPPGVDFQDYLFNAASDSKCVVVLWSTASVQSRWVLFEAGIALRRRTLLPVVIDAVTVPSEFANIQAAKMPNWYGDEQDPSFLIVVDAVRRFIDAAPDTAKVTRIYKANQRTAERRAQELFQQNCRSEVTIEHIDLKHTAFYDDLNWNVNPAINVVLGRNGYGKTYFLRGLLAMLQYSDKAAVATVGGGSGTVSIDRDGREEAIHFSDNFFDEENAVGQVPVLAIPDARFVNRSVTTLGAVSDETTQTGDRADLARFGAWHFLEERPYETMIQSFLYGLCLDYFQAGLNFEGEQFQLIRDIVRELTDNTFEFARIAREGRDKFTLYVRTEGNEENPLPIQKSSQGTLSVIAMVGMIYSFLQSLQPPKPATTDIRQRHGIVVIDEIDAHLHPVWQQKIVGILRDRFPRVQFILTAHNPIVVAGCLEDEVSVLRKGAKRGFSLVQFPNDFVGWQTEEIYRKVFEIENPDSTFTHYDAMRPFKGQFQKEAAALAKKANRSADEESSLKALEVQILYIGKVEQTRAVRLTQEELERENKILKDRVMGLESAHASGDLRRQMDEAAMREKAERAAWARERRRMAVASAGVIAIMIIVIIVLILLRLR